MIKVLYNGMKQLTSGIFIGIYGLDYLIDIVHLSLSQPPPDSDCQ